MATNDLIKRLLEAGASFTQMTQSRAEGIVRELVRLGEVGAGEAQDAVHELLERGRDSSERVVALVQGEVSRQLHSLGVPTRDDVARLEARIDALAARTSTASSDADKKAKTASKKTAKKRAAAKKSTGEAATKKTYGG